MCYDDLQCFLYCCSLGVETEHLSLSLSVCVFSKMTSHCLL